MNSRSFRFDWRIDRDGAGPVRVELGGGKLDMTEVVRAIPPGTVTETRIPLRCFKAAGADLGAVGAPLRIDSGAGLAITVRSVRIVEGGGDGRCPAIAR